MAFTKQSARNPKADLL